MTTAAHITQPGLYPTVSEDAYHADPVAGGSLSSTGARKLLSPNCPAHFAYWRDHPEEHKQEWDIGKAAHKLVLGDGPALARVEADDWRTKKAQEAREAAYERGAVPLLAAQHDQVRAMAAALRAHKTAATLFDPDRGRPEQTLVWRDAATGVMCRCRLDWLPEHGPGRLIIPDYKSAVSADPEKFARAVERHRYDQQDDFYRAGGRALQLGGDDTAFVFVVQEKTPPYVVTVVELDPPTRRIGAARNRRALQTYAECTTTGVWPAYQDDIAQVGLPGWTQMRDEEEYL